MRDVFLDLRGQDDNLGDSALRCGLVNAVRRSDRQFHMLVGSASADYLSGFDLAPADRIYQSGREWVGAIYRTSRPALVMQAGEMRRWRRPRRHMAWPLVGSLRVRQKRGPIMLTGVGIRNPGSPGLLDQPLGPRLSALTAWRDKASQRSGGRGDVYPDWAFSLGSPTSAWADLDSRGILAVSLRFDRPAPNEAWTRRVRAFADEQGLELVTFAQVLRDRPRSRALATQLGCTFQEWGDSHSEMNSAAREMFRMSRYVLSDRVHALIIGATEGAIPVGSPPIEIEKLERTLEPVGLEANVAVQSEVGALLRRVDSCALVEKIDSARTQLRELTERMDLLLDRSAGLVP